MSGFGIGSSDLDRVVSRLAGWTRQLALRLEDLLQIRGLAVDRVCLEI